MRILGIAVLVLLASASARADTLLLKDGRALVGPGMEETTDGVVVHFEHGEVHVPKGDVLARYDEDDPEADLQRKAHQRHRLWRNRYKEEVLPFRFETTMSRSVFHLYRDRMLAYYRALVAELGVEVAEDASVKVCLYGNRKDFLQIGGAGGGVLAVHQFHRGELGAFDDPSWRRTCLRALQWATASYVISLAFPALPHQHPAHSALTDYYAAAEQKADDPSAFQFGLVNGYLWQRLRGDPARHDESGLRQVVDRSLRRHVAYQWALVHDQLVDPKRRAEFLEHLRGLGADASAEEPADLLELLQIQGDDECSAALRDLKAHIASVRPSTVVDLVDAARAAEQQEHWGRARSLCQEALTLAPEDLEARSVLAGILEEGPDRGSERTAWQEVLAVAPLDVDARENLALCLEDMGQGTEAAEVRKLALEVRAALEAP